MRWRYPDGRQASNVGRAPVGRRCRLRLDRAGETRAEADDPLAKVGALPGVGGRSPEPPVVRMVVDQLCKADRVRLQRDAIGPSGRLEEASMSGLNGIEPAGDGSGQRRFGRAVEMRRGSKAPFQRFLQEALASDGARAGRSHLPGESSTVAHGVWPYSINHPGLPSAVGRAWMRRSCTAHGAWQEGDTVTPGWHRP